MNNPSVRSTLKQAIWLAVMMTCAPTAMSAGCCDVEERLSADLVEDIAAATFAAYTELKALGCTDSARNPSDGCAGDVYTTWSNVRALVHTVNALSNSGPTEFSLGTDVEGLVQALRWNAGEEFAGQQEMIAGFSNGQQASLQSRITALRSGATGFSITGTGNTGLPITGLNAGDEGWSQWGGFLNATYSYGNAEGTAREDAYDFDAVELNGGVDYRLSDRWTVGGLAAYTQQVADFDSSASVVDGEVAMRGFAVSGFALYQREAWYADMAAGVQKSVLSTDRSIRYTSLNVNVPSPNTVATSDADALNWHASANLGFAKQLTDTVTLEPYVSVNYQHVTIGEFTERDVNNSGFDLTVAEQDYDSLETVVALKLSHVFSSDYGVFIPFADVQWFAQHRNDPRTVSATYANLSGVLSADAYMQLQTDRSDGEYKVVHLGFASVLRGASQKTLDAPATGGIQAFVKLSRWVGIGNFNQRSIAAGVRYEF